MTRHGTAEDWRVYYQRTGNRPPRETLLLALDLFDGADAAGHAPRHHPRYSLGHAVDLGCGGGRDSVEMLRRGWSVLAIDAQASAIESLLARPELAEIGVLPGTQISRFETARWPMTDLVNSSFALPLCPRAAFPAVWQRIYDNLRPGGRFCGQLYGDRDQWAGDPTNSHFSRPEIEDLLQAYDIELLREEETDSKTPRGTLKHWHIFHIVARKS